MEIAIEFVKEELVETQDSYIFNTAALRETQRRMLGCEGRPDVWEALQSSHVLSGLMASEVGSQKP